MGALEDFTILHQIALGSKDVDTLASVAYPLEKSDIRLIVEKLLRSELVKTEEGLCVSKKGLLELSRQIAKLAHPPEYLSEYFFWSVDGLPFFRYENGFSKDVITHPGLLFEPAGSYVDDEKQVVYVTSLPEIDFDLENIEIVNNLLFETDYLHPTGFWLLNFEKKKLCGWGINNLAKTLALVKQPTDLVFLCAYQDFILMIDSNLNTTRCGKMNLKVYITKAIFPYIDTLDFLADKLKTFLIFNRMQGLPTGHEIKLETISEWKEFPKHRLRFTPKLVGTILHRTADNRIDLFPYIFAVTLPPDLNHLGAVSPWFITCPGGCLDQEFRKLHYVHLFQLVSLPEIDVATLMISNT